MSSQEQEQQTGFEYDGEFYPMSFTTGAKDMLLIDRLTHMTLDEFEETVNSPNMRISAVLGLLATSIRAKHPDWSVERIFAMVTEVDFDQLETIGPEPDPTTGGQTEPPETADAKNSDSPSGESSSSVTPLESSSSATSAETLA